jgi:DNA-binding transcriptional LysR family regulator
MSVEVNHLRYVVAAAQFSSFRRAAAALNIAQPTLSKRIRELEERLGVTLFERSTSGAQLTVDGEDFVVRARHVLAELNEIEHRAKAGKAGTTGRLEIGFYTALAGPLRDVVFTFAHQYPQVDVNITEDDRLTLIALVGRGVIDVAVVLGGPACPDYANMSLWSERVMVAFPKNHPLAERDFVYWTDLKNERFVLSRRDPGSEINDILLTKLASPGDRPFVKQVKAHHSLMINAVDGARGITLTYESASTTMLPGVVFREVRDGNGPTRLGFVAYWRRSNENPALKHFLNQLQAYAPIPSPSSNVT